MNILNGVVLGLVQGITEFLPISSSGHLIIARELLGLSIQNSLSYDVLLHLATLLAIILCFWGDIRNILTDAKSGDFSFRSMNLLYCLILGSIPAGLVGFFYGDKIEEFFRNPTDVAYALIFGSLLFLIADKIHSAIKTHGISPFRSILIGVFQALAFIPGFSRSGSTISGGLITGLSREEAIKFAFLLGIPITSGAIFKTLLDIGVAGLAEFMTLAGIVGFLTALFSGLWAVRFLVRYLSSNSFTPFIIYRILLALVILFLL